MFASQSTILASIAAAWDSAMSRSNHSRRDRDLAPSDGDAYSPRAAERGSVRESMSANFAVARAHPAARSSAARSPAAEVSPVAA